MTVSKTLDYSDIVLQPDDKKPCCFPSRDDLSTEIEFLGCKFANPVLPANMAVTINTGLAETLDSENYFYIHHRFEPYENILKWIKKEEEFASVTSVSVGVKQKDYDFIDSIARDKLSVDFLTIDVSHGYHNSVKNIALYIKKHLPSTKVIAGNVTSAKACKDYIKWGIDAAKVGLARGKACTTFNNTGVGSFMFSAVKECAATGLPIIADGGIREIKDISIAMVAGANMVMVGSLFAACIDSPAEIYKPYPDLNIEYKIYYGSASAKNKGHNRYVEGSDRVELTPSKMNYLEFHNKIEDGLKSTMSFANVSNIKDLTKMKYLYK